MIKPTDTDKEQLDIFLKQVMSHWQNPASIFDSYTTQRQKMLLDRLRLQAQIMLIVGLTVIGFFCG
jgi:hypothetical protein